MTNNLEVKKTIGERYVIFAAITKLKVDYYGM